MHSELGPAVLENRLEGRVVWADRFGNLLTNIDACFLRSFRDPTVSMGSRVFPMHRTYGEVAPGSFLALINAFSVLEIAQSGGSALLALGVGVGSKLVVCEGDCVAV